MGASGVVESVKESGAVRVRFGDGKQWTLNPILLVNGFAEDKWIVGDAVMIQADEQVAATMQQGHGGWTSAMKEVGHLGMEREDRFLSLSYDSSF
jgi:hypothetical protein